MYKVISEGRVIGYCEQIRYIKKNPNSGALIQCEKNEAIGIAINGKPYNFEGELFISNAPCVRIIECDVGEIAFKNEEMLIENTEVTTVSILNIENALCELDSLLQEVNTWMKSGQNV